jgi:hypothetical protein
MSPSQSRHSNMCALQVCSIFQTGLADPRHADTAWAHRTPEGGRVEAREFSSCTCSCNRTGSHISLKAMHKNKGTARSSRKAGRLLAPVSGPTGQGEIKTA